MTNTENKLLEAINTAWEIGQLTDKLKAQLGVLVGEMKGATRTYEAGLIIGIQDSLRSGPYAQIAAHLDSMLSGD